MKVPDRCYNMDNFIVVKPPRLFTAKASHISVFLAGSIEMGAAEDWQAKITEALDALPIPMVVYNPRRDDWDSSWEQSIDAENFNEQVTWELDHLEQVDLILLYFDPTTKAPITLMELGLHADSHIIVYCPDEFWRKGNVDIVCARHDIPVFEDYDSFIAKITTTLWEMKGLNHANL